MEKIKEGTVRLVGNTTKANVPMVSTANLSINVEFAINMVMDHTFAEGVVIKRKTEMRKGS